MATYIRKLKTSNERILPAVFRYFVASCVCKHTGFAVINVLRGSTHLRLPACSRYFSVHTRVFLLMFTMYIEHCGSVETAYAIWYIYRKYLQNEISDKSIN